MILIYIFYLLVFLHFTLFVVYVLLIVVFYFVYSSHLVLSCLVFLPVFNYLYVFVF